MPSCDGFAGVPRGGCGIVAEREQGRRRGDGRPAPATNRTDSDPMRCARCDQDNPEGARFCNQCGAPLAAAPGPELRRLTVLFCDLVGSVQLANRLDPEEWHALLAAYQEAAGQAIRRHQGHVAQHLGDGLVAYFGYPVAHEDDALRAVRAALDLVREAGTVAVPHSGERLSVRVGVHTGAAVMGPVGSGGDVLALGDTPHIAARLQAVAPPGAVALSPAARTLVEHRVRWADLGEHALKGLPGAMRVHQAVALRTEGEEGAEPGRSPFVGRARELGQLVDAWDASQAGGAGVLLLGEPGIGKSRLARELRAQVRVDGGDSFTMRCSPHTANTPFAPLAQFLRQAMAQAGAPDGSADALSGVLAAVGVRDERVVAPLRALLGLGRPGDAEAALSAQALRERTFAAATAVLATMSARRRTLSIVEDLHWADPSTLEWLGRVLGAGAPPGLMLLLLARTEFTPPWREDPRWQRLLLEPCDARDAAAIVTALDDGHLLGAEAIARIVERAEGNPLFAEEFTRAALEDRTDVIPLTLQEQTTARLDRLGPARQVLQHAAVIGRQFSRPQLCAASGLAPELVEEGLQRGVAARMLRPLGDDGDSFAFRHALLRDAAYGSLLRSSRQAGHARVAQALVAADPDIARRQPELLAHHYTEAGDGPNAVAQWLAAGRLALSRSACVEAAAHARTALRMIGDTGSDPAALALELELRLVLAPALMAVRGVLDPEVERTYARARHLCERLGNGPKLLVPLWGLWAYELMRGEIPNALEAAAQLRALAQAGTPPVAALVAAATTGMTLFYQGDLRGAREACAAGLGPAAPSPSAARSARGLHDPGVMCRAFHSLACWLLGDAEAAAAGTTLLRESIPRLPPFDAAYAWCSEAVLHTLAGDAQPAAEASARAIAIGREQAFPAWQMMGTMMQGWSRAKQGEAARALPTMQRALEAWYASGARNLRPFFHALLADAWLAQGDAQQALRSADDGLAEASSGEHCWDPELHRLRAEAWAALGEHAPALEAASRAVEAAERMEARAWTERAASSRERILREQSARG